MTTSTARRMDEIGDESRRRILDAAEQLFSEKGFEKTSFVDIAALSGISRGSIPWHFKNKDGLLLAVVERVNHRYMSLDQMSESPKLEEILARYGVLARDFGGRLMFAVLTEALNTDSVVHEEYKAYHAQHRRRVAHWLKFVGVRSEKTREALATAILGSMIGITLQWQIDPEGVDLEASFKGLAKLVDEAVPNG